MIVESVQMLCTHLTLTGSDPGTLPYRPTHAHHPCTKWLSESDANVAWLRAHADELGLEYSRRYGKVHRSHMALRSIESLLPDAAIATEHTAFVQAMPEEFRDVDAVVAYRAFYMVDKADFAVWEPRAREPSWWRRL